MDTHPHRHCEGVDLHLEGLELSPWTHPLCHCESADLRLEGLELSHSFQSSRLFSKCCEKLADLDSFVATNAALVRCSQVDEGAGHTCPCSIRGLRTKKCILLKTKHLAENI